MTQKNARLCEERSDEAIPLKMLSSQFQIYRQTLHFVQGDSTRVILSRRRRISLCISVLLLDGCYHPSFLLDDNIQTEQNDVGGVCLCEESRILRDDEAISFEFQLFMVQFFTMNRLLHFVRNDCCTFWANSSAFFIAGTYPHAARSFAISTCSFAFAKSFASR